MGGGQPIFNSNKVSKDKVKFLRACALYEADEKSPKRISMENKEVKRLYKDYLGEPNKEKAHNLLHTKYNKQEVYTK